MTRFISLCIVILSCGPADAQTARDIIHSVSVAQHAIVTINYSLTRSDTFVTGQTRLIKGQAKMKILPNDSIMGFAYWAKREDKNQETIYDGHLAFNIDHEAKQYQQTASASMIPHYLGSPGGQMILKDFIRLDTVGATGFNMQKQNQFYVITMILPDIKEYDVSKRIHVFYIDQKTFLPMRVIYRQETLGKVQNLDYKIDRLIINDAALAYNFSTERYPATYKEEKRVANKKLYGLINQPMPLFELTSFGDSLVTQGSISDKVVLLDFWEVWCGPCIASMPKVDSLYQKYKSQGLAVFGMMSEHEQLEAAKLLIRRRGVGFPNLVSNEKLKSMLGIEAVPTYILINRKGIICYITEGFSDTIEGEIQKALL